MEFDYCIPEETRLRAHISQRSNLKYVKTVMDVFDDRQRDEFRNSPFRYLAEVAEIQFSAQLIQQLVFRTIRTDKVNELWFNVQGNMMRFGLQEYTLVTGLRCGVFPKGDEFDRVLERRRLKERVGYRRLLHGFRGFWAKKFLKAKRRQEKEVTYTIHGFPIAMQKLESIALVFVFLVLVVLSQRKEMDRIKAPWSPNENELLQRLVEKHGPRYWSLISKSIVGQSGKSCSFPPKCSIGLSHLKKMRLSFGLMRILGTNGHNISFLLSSPTDNAIKNHWNSTLKRKCFSIFEEFNDFELENLQQLKSFSSVGLGTILGSSYLYLDPSSPSGYDLCDPSLF
ncbi:transcription factor MYB44-like [Olea europaea subsp. europaea]|uniref:Transcription factor MYB44-like n=1 Tax=Olea europaea subsp. europaea TaxID=158383 RepID=A0A8S0PE76_OLEEU|nr:transcription factor MYB44-like [Olea europaea subsp. europaea]